MKKLKSSKQPNPYARKILIQSKVNADEMREILRRAHSWTDGNVSELLRVAALTLKPSKSDFQK